MSDISKIQLNDTSYDLRDNEARDNFANYLPLTGGIINGDISVNTLSCVTYSFEEVQGESLSALDISVDSLMVGSLQTIKIGNSDLKQILAQLSTDILNSI